MIQSPAIERFSIAAVTEFRLNDKKRSTLKKLATSLLTGEPALAETSAFGNRVNSGVADGVALLIANSFDIPLLESNGISSMEYRMSLLAREGDILVIRGSRDIEFEQYREEKLALGSLTVVNLSDCAPGDPIDLRPHSNSFRSIFSAVKSAVRPGECLTLIPYIGTGSIWKMAEALSLAADIDVCVAAPPPVLTRRVNDKLWFTSCSAQVYGKQSIPPTKPAYGPAALTGLVRSFSRRYKQVVVKVPDSAGSAGNIKIESDQIKSTSASRLQQKLIESLHHRGWHNSFPLMVEVWDANVLSSPSAQIWIPETEMGDPVFQGIFDQIVSSDYGRFVGATVADIPYAWEQRIIEESMQLAFLYQQLGYYGQVSFDTVIAGRSYQQANLHWIECNGRWGGVSIPLTLLNRLLGDYRNKHFIIVQDNQDGVEKLPFKKTVTALKGELLQSPHRMTGLVLPIPDAAGVNAVTNCIVVADTLSDANRKLVRVNDSLKKVD